MPNLSSSELAKSIELARNSPAAIQRLMLNAVEMMTDGEHVIVDPSNPFVLLMEAAATVGSVTMQNARNITRPLYPSVVTTPEDLYLHMSDEDFLDRFAEPSEINFLMFLPVDEIQQRAISLEDGTRIRKLTIPRHTTIRVADNDYTFQYPLDLLVLPHGTITANWDTSTTSPIQTLSTSDVPSQIVKLGNVRYLTLSFNIKQMTMTSHTSSISAVSGFSKNLAFSDKFHYARAFIKNTNGTWMEIYTTHSDMVYDPTKPTAVLEVTPGNLNVTIPRIYFTNGLIRDSLRIDIYTTKGPLNVNYGNLEPGAFTASWKDYDADNNNVYSAPLNTFSSIILSSSSDSIGGREELSFGELRNRVIHRSVVTEGKPITPGQLSNRLKDLGFNKVTLLDNVTDRIELATRAIDPPEDGSTVTGAGCTVQLLQAKMTDLALLDTVMDNGLRLTLLPETLYRLDNGILSIVDKAVVDQLKNPQITAPDALANIVNSASYYYTPFHYVLDSSGNEFEARPYRLDKPEILFKEAVFENPSLYLDSSIGSYQIVKRDDNTGYTIWLEIQTNDVFKDLNPDQVCCQLSYSSEEVKVRTYFNGTQQVPIDSNTGKTLDGRFVFAFEIPTAWDIDAEHNLILSESGNAIPLISKFDVAVFVRDHLPEGATVSSIDDLINPIILPNYIPTSNYIGVTHETLTIKFGSFMKRLWARTRSIASEESFERYESDVPAFHERIVYDTDKDGNIKMVLNEDGKLEFNIIHNVGEPMVTETGTPIYKHRKGEVKLDYAGNPVIKDGLRGILREINLFLVDGKYYFVTGDEASSYREKFTTDIETWVTSTLEPVASQLLERTQLFFHPKSSVGRLQVVTGDGATVYVNADQTLKVYFDVSDDVYSNSTLRQNIEKTTKRKLLEVLSTKTTLSLSDMIAELKSEIGDNQLGLSIEGFMGDQYKTVSLSDMSAAPTIGKRLVVESNLTVTIEDDVYIEFNRHRAPSAI